MIKYQGSKSKYEGAIYRVMSSYRDFNCLPLVEGCCGSAVLSYYTKKEVSLIDKGPWGEFWARVVRCNAEDIAAYLDIVRPESYKPWFKTIVHKSVPNNDATFIATFLALQREAFSGKAVEIRGWKNRREWAMPGYDRSPSYKKWCEAINKVLKFKPKIKQATQDDLNHKTIEEPSNIYIDPDYTGTTGYSLRSLDVKSFVYRHPHCNIFVSHNTYIPGIEWSSHRDITVHGNGQFKTNDNELLHVKLRS